MFLCCTGWEPVASGIPPKTVRDVFKYHVCLRTTASRELLRYLSLRAGNPNEAARLEALASNYEAYNVWRMDEPSIVDVFKEFPSLKVDSAELANMLPPLQPRYY